MLTKSACVCRAYIRELQRCLTSETVWQPDSSARQRLTKLVEAQRTVMMLFMRVSLHVLVFARSSPSMQCRRVAVHLTL